MKTKSLHKENSIINIKGQDIFEYASKRIYAQNNGATVIVPHVCNNINAFGAGFAGAVSNKYPIVKENYHLLGKNFLKNNLGYTQYVDVLSDKNYGHKLIFANMIAQNGILSETNHRPLNYFALIKCMASVAQYIRNNFDKDNNIEIHCPRFGSGLAGGNWLFIQDLIDDIWTNIPVFVYLI